MIVKKNEDTKVQHIFYSNKSLNILVAYCIFDIITMCIEIIQVDNYNKIWLIGEILFLLKKRYKKEVFWYVEIKSFFLITLSKKLSKNDF